MKKYRILKTEHVIHLEDAYQLKLINEIVEGVEGTDYIHVIINQIEFLFLKSEVKEIKERLSTNKTAIINSIITNRNNKNIDEVKEVIRIKNRLREYSIKTDIDYIEYKYNRLIELYYLSEIGAITWEIKYILNDTIDLILKSNIKLKNGYELEKVKQWQLEGY